MFQLFVLPDVNPVSLQLDLDRKFQLQGIMMDFKVRFLGGGSGMERDPGPCGLRPLAADSFPSSGGDDHVLGGPPFPRLGDTYPEPVSQ